MLETWNLKLFEKFLPIIQKCIDSLSLHVQFLSDTAQVVLSVKSIHEPEWSRVIRLITEIMSYEIIFQLYLPLIIKQKKMLFNVSFDRKFTNNL